MPDVFTAACSLEGVRSSLNAARDGIDAVLRDRGLRRSTPEDTASALLMGAAATSSLEGDVVSADELSSGGGGTTARAALRLSTELLPLIPVWRRSPIQALARIHAIAAAGSVSGADLGRPIDPPGRDRLMALSRALLEPTDAPALGIAAYAHAEILTADAFGSHDGVVARAVERLILVERGVDPASVLVPEVGHWAAGDAYRAALATFSPDDPHTWMLYATEAFTRAAEASPLAR